MTPGPDRQFDRGAVLERALELFWAQGYEATGMAQLLEHVGIGRQSLYNAFGDKHSLYVEALGHYARGQHALVKEILERPGSPLANLRAFFRCKAEEAAEGASCGCFMGNALAELGRDDPKIRELTGFVVRTLEELFRDTLVKARELGELRPEAPVEDIARTLVAGAQGMALLSRLENSDTLMDSALRVLLDPWETQHAAH